LLLLCSFCLTISEAQTTDSAPLAIRTYGVRINVTDMDKAIDFYSRQLGFEIESKRYYPNLVELKSNDHNKLVLKLVRNLVAEGPKDVKAGLTLQVNDYDKAVAGLKERGVDFGTNVKRKEGVGYSIYFSDPFGTQLSTMQVTVVKEEPFAEPRIYNYGILVPDMDKAREFFKSLALWKEVSGIYRWICHLVILIKPLDSCCISGRGQKRFTIILQMMSTSLFYSRRMI
jgi:predicted enzyme related to lactoylglutathione lyase